MKIKKILIAAAIALLSILGLSTCANAVLNSNNSATVSNSSSTKETASNSSADKTSSSASASASDKKGTSEASSSGSSASSSAKSSSTDGSVSGPLSQDDAIAAALADAGVAAEDATVTAVTETSVDGVNQVKVEFTSQGKEYEYTLNADSGEIIEKGSESADESSESDAEDSDTATSSLSAAQQEKILAAAAADAGVAVEDATLLGLEQDEEDGTKQVDVDFVSNGVRYHYILNAANNEVIETSSSPAE
ncbi:PepSY domain-containing protein [Streptococcus cuniculipharyngis]|uniref:PepSY domain-containing protein n=1 Tax=Streptococcus cuniculipharyngis TaxID=1562651 RepID=A0A5C5SB70_9STRE|nr:PepSY domain-containing protein [Streptococcus cuniculipharyngis]TWS98127.1 hypothetical protein FRX57_04150 [Streptococcus cuniculipharyngis]